MNTHFTDVLDIALQRQADHETSDTILADYPQQGDDLQPLLMAVQTLDTVHPVVMPEDKVVAADRQLFLGQIEQLLPTPVSLGPLARLKGWMVHQIPWLIPNTTIQKKEPKPMSALLLKATLILTVIFGSVGGTAVMAAESLPDSPIYPLKIAMEDARLAYNQDAANEAALHLAFAEERASEMIALAQEGNVPDEATQARLELHINEALNIAAQQPDETMRPLLTQAQLVIQTQTQNMVAAQTGATEPAQQMLGEAGGFLARAGQEIEAGLQDPQLFRSRFGMPDATVPQEKGPCNTDDCEPVGEANQFGQEPENDGHNGPGDGICEGEDCEPVGEANQFGQEPENDGHNGPGDGTCEGEDCEPVGEANQFGQEPENDGHNGPGDGTCEGEDCNQYQYQQEEPPLEPYQHQIGDGECNNDDCEPGGSDMNHGDGNIGDGNNGDGNNGDGNGDGNNGDGNNGDGNNGGK